MRCALFARALPPMVTGASHNWVRTLSSPSQRRGRYVFGLSKVIKDCLSIEEVEALRSTLQPPLTAVKWNHLATAYANVGHLERALSIPDEMKRDGVQPDVHTYSRLITACQKEGEWEHALSLLEEMHKAGCSKCDELQRSDFRMRKGRPVGTCPVLTRRDAAGRRGP